MKKVTARFYVGLGGAMPVRDWLLSLSRDDRRTIGRDVQRVEFGWPLGMPYCRSLGDGLWEVRSSLQSGRIARLIFCFVGGEIALLHGFHKTTQKTPKADLDLALRRKKDLEG